MKNSFQRKIQRKIQRKSKKQYAGSSGADFNEVSRVVCKKINFNDMDGATMRKTILDLPTTCADDEIKKGCDMVKILDTGLWEIVLNVLREAHEKGGLRRMMNRMIYHFDEGTKARKFLETIMAFDSDASDDDYIMSKLEEVDEYYRQYEDYCNICNSALDETVDFLNETPDDENLLPALKEMCAAQQAGRRSRQNRRRSYRKRM